MKTYQIGGVAEPPKEEPQQRLHRSMAEFCREMKRQRDAEAIQGDTTQSAPVSMLPMVF